MTTGLKIGLLLVLAFQSKGVELPQDFNICGPELSIYAPGASQAFLNCKVERLFIDHRKFGFFQIRLLPILVAQGVQIKLGDVHSGGDWWMGDLQSNLVPQINRHAVEWRDVDLTFQKTNSAHLHAKVMRLTGEKGPIICHLENVTIEAGGSKLRLLKADLRTEHESQRVVWKTDEGALICLDLCTGEMVNKKN